MSESGVHENVCQDHYAHENFRDLLYLERNFPFLLSTSLLHNVPEGHLEAMSLTLEHGSVAVFACRFMLTLRHHFLCAFGSICVYCKGSSNDVTIKQG